VHQILNTNQRYLPEHHPQTENLLFAYSFIKEAIRLVTLGGASSQ
jgi:hypothetical protein